MLKKQIQIIGYASCYGAQDQRCDTGPTTLKKLKLSEALETANIEAQWTPYVTADHAPQSQLDALAVISNNCKELASQARAAVEKNKQIIVIGGDHSCAIGTWSGVYSALPANSSLGLIWIDAHMDSHTMATSKSGAIHGMPVASLLGYGDPSLCNIESTDKKVDPANLCLVGIRSFEPAEETLLNNLGVKIFYMDDIHEQGLSTILSLAYEHVSRGSDKYGISLDLDAIDPEDAPGVGSPENHGISGKDLINALKNIGFGEKFIGIEIAELNSKRDRVDKTARLAIDAILACLSQNTNSETP